MRKNGVNRTFVPLAEGEISVDGFVPCAAFFRGIAKAESPVAEAGQRENAALSLLGLNNVLFCRPPANAAYLTGGNAFLPYFHEAAKTAAQKDKAKAAIFFDGAEKPFSVREKAACEKALKDIFFSLRIGRNEIISFTNYGGASRKIVRTYAFRIGDYPCRLCCMLRCGEKGVENNVAGEKSVAEFAGAEAVGAGAQAQNSQGQNSQGQEESVRYAQFLLLTDAKISTPMLQKILESLANEPLHFCDETAGGRAFDAAAFLSSARAENYPISSPDAEYAKVLRLIRSIFYDFLIYAAKESGGKLVNVRVSGAKSAREASAVALAFVRRRAVFESLKNRYVSPLLALECIGSAGERNRGSVTAELTSPEGKVCLVCEGSPLAPRRETAEKILSAESAELSIDLSSGNYSYSACMYVPGETNRE